MSKNRLHSISSAFAKRLFNSRNPISSSLLINASKYNALASCAIDVPVNQSRESNAGFIFNNIYNCHVVIFHAGSSKNATTEALHINNPKDRNLEKVAKKFSHEKGAYAKHIINATIASDMVGMQTRIESMRTDDFVVKILRKHNIPNIRHFVSTPNFIIDQQGKIYQQPTLYSIYKKHIAKDTPVASHAAKHQGTKRDSPPRRS